MVGALPDFQMSIGRRAAQCRPAHHRQVRPVIAHCRSRTPVKPQCRQRLFGSRAFVFRAEMRMGNAQRLQARTQHRAVPAGDDHRRNAGFLQHLEAVAVQGVETLDDFTGRPEAGRLPGLFMAVRVFRKIQSAVGQHTVDIKKGHLDTLAAQQQFRRKVQERRCGCSRQSSRHLR